MPLKDNYKLLDIDCCATCRFLYQREDELICWHGHPDKTWLGDWVDNLAICDYFVKKMPKSSNHPDMDRRCFKCNHSVGSIDDLYCWDGKNKRLVEYSDICDRFEVEK